MNFQTRPRPGERGYFQVKHFYGKFFKLYAVFVLQNVITLCVNLADNMMLGSYGEAALSGSAAVNQIQFIFQQVLTALGECAVMFGSQYWGKRQTGPIKRIGAIAMGAGLLTAVCLFGLMSLFPAPVMRLFTTDPDIIREGVAYIGIIRFTYLLFAVSMILLAILRSVEVVKIGFYLSVVSLLINIAGNYILIYGKFGAPELGIRGAACSTLLARIVELSLLILYIRKKEGVLRLKIKDFLYFDVPLLRHYAKMAAPMLAISGLWGVSTALQTVILGHMTAIAIAANSVASTLFLLMKQASVGAGQTAAVIIGQTIGAGDMKAVKKAAVKLQKVFALIGIVGGVFLFFLRIPILSIYHLSKATRAMTNTFLIILSVIFVGMGYQMPASEGIIRGGGKPQFVMKMNLVSSWLIVLPLSFLLAFYFKASPAAVVWCLNADQIFKCVPVFIEANFGHWIVRLTKSGDEESGGAQAAHM